MGVAGFGRSGRLVGMISIYPCTPYSTNSLIIEWFSNFRGVSLGPGVFETEWGQVLEVFGRCIRGCSDGVRGEHCYCLTDISNYDHL